MRLTNTGKCTFFACFIQSVMLALGPKKNVIAWRLILLLICLYECMYLLVAEQLDMQVINLQVGDKLIAHHSGIQKLVKCYLVAVASELVHVTCFSTLII